MEAPPRVLVVAARFYGDIADALIAGSEAVLGRAGAMHEIAEVPGAFEIPAAISFAADTEHLTAMLRWVA